MKKHPKIYIIAGPNGVGKTTFARKFLPQYAKCSNFVNADLIASGLSPFAPDSAAIRAGKLLLNEIHSLAENKSDFAFETTLSGKTHLSFLEAQKKRGYFIHIFFLWVPSVKLALDRIKDRVENGGHYVKSSDVKRRFPRSIRNFFNLYIPLADSWYLFENSAYLPHLIAKNKSGQTIINNAELFKKISEKKMAAKDALGLKAEKALKEAVRELFEERAREDRPVVIWQNGKVIRVSAREIMDKEESTRG